MPLYEFLRREAGLSGPYIMPVPFFNVLNGGVHSGNTMAFQEIMIAPVGAESFEQAMQFGSETYQALKKILAKKFGSAATGIGDEGGFAPPITKPEEALDLLEAAVKECGYTGKIKFAIDPASSEFFTEEGAYDVGFKDKQSDERSRGDMIELYRRLVKSYPIVLLEDPFAEDDWETWTEFNKDCPIELVGGLQVLTEDRGVAGAIGIILFPGVLAFLMTASEFALLKRTSAVTLSVCGIFKEVLTISAAGLIFGDKLTTINISGLVVTIASIAAYNYMKMQKMRDGAKREAHQQMAADEPMLSTEEGSVKGTGEHARKASTTGGLIRHSLSVNVAPSIENNAKDRERTSPIKRPEDLE